MLRCGVLRMIGYRLPSRTTASGYASDDATPKGTGLGTLIIGAMAKTLQGTVEKEPTDIGSRIVLSFPAAG